MADIGRVDDREALFNDMMRNFENSRRAGRDEGVLEQIRAENERAAKLARELKAENDRQQAILNEQRAENDRAERLREQAVRDKKIDEIKRVRRARRTVLERIITKANSIADTRPELYGQLPIEPDVVENANPNDDSLPVNFVTTHPEYIAWRRSPAYDEFMDRVRSGEESRIDDSIEI